MNNNYETPFSAEEIDEQIDFATQRLRSKPASAMPIPDLRLIEDIQRAYPADDEEMARALERVRQRLLSSAPSVSQGEQHTGPSGRLYSLAERRQRMRSSGARFRAGQQITHHIATIAAVIVLLALVGGLAAGLILVHHGSSSGGGHPLIDPHLHIYVGTQSDIKKLDASTGKRLWTHSTNGEAVSTPAVAHGLVYIAPEGENLFALNASNGSVRWRFSRPVQAGQYVAPAPVVAGNALYVGDTQMDAVYALNAETGALLWQHAGPPETTQHHAAICDVSVAANVVYSCESGESGGDRLIALNAETGGLLWSVPALLGQLAAPRVVNGAIYIPSWELVDSSNYISYLSAYNVSNGQLLWRSSLSPAQIGTALAVADGVVYITTNRIIKLAANGTILQEEGDLLALSASDGSTLWRYQTQANLFLSQQVVNGVLYAGALPGVGSGSVMALNVSDGSVRWQQHLHSNYIAAPMVALDGVLFVNEPDVFCALDATDGSQMWCTPLVSAIGTGYIPFTVAP